MPAGTAAQPQARRGGGAERQTADAAACSMRDYDLIENSAYTCVCERTWPCVPQVTSPDVAVHASYA